ncbi:Os06g0603400 [Oryza sativa Japonica Group]|uniref:Os06g0603400 protein n=2 Tax=Oryza sativa subsp. japonica TaxID=39947 RepID=Q0DB47_ORYSJ|nr:hypothetical protein EE612_035186 [Oryza sativa]BAF19926.1 Os06g0603400 [Oryza sativa Japonica Group]BAS98510.1 Os06g0603400 [Oryza sativa Japonica Group]|eukprot:NP_001058012.1 Os06g0603400 [Oryza sativa Japonica Group]
MPPRKRPPPPAKAPEAPPETKPKISPPAKPIAAAPPPPKAVLSDTVLAALSQHERPIYKLVFAGGDKGMSQTEIRIKTGMPTSTLTKHLRDLRAGRVCYRRGGPVQGGMMERIPCGVCPRIDECSPDGVISPSTCVYYKKWLQMDF